MRRNPDQRESSDPHVDLNGDPQQPANGDRQGAPRRVKKMHRPAQRSSTRPSPEPSDESQPRKPRRLGPATLLFIRLAGVNRAVLERTRRLDIAYFVGLGATVLMTGTLAAISATFGLSVAFGGSNVLAYLPIGLLWGLAILNIDRWLVSGNDGGFVQPEKAGSVVWRYPLHVLENTLKILPRLAVALLLGFLFAEPLLTRVFEKEVKDTIEIRAKSDAQVGDLERLTEKQAVWDQDKNRLEDDVDSARDALAAAESDQRDSGDVTLKSLQDAYDSTRGKLDTTLDDAKTSKEGHTAGKNQDYAANSDRATNDVAGIVADAKYGIEEIYPKGCFGRCADLLKEADEKRVAYKASYDAQTDAVWDPLIATDNAQILITQDEINKLGARPTSVSTTQSPIIQNAQTALDNASGALGKLGDRPVAVAASVVQPRETLYHDSGLLDRIDALHNVGDRKVLVSTAECPSGSLERFESSDGGQPKRYCVFKNGRIGTATWVVRAALIAIDVLPVFFKWLMSLFPATAYYEELDEEKQRLKEERRARRDARRKRLEIERQRGERLAIVRNGLIEARADAYERALSAARLNAGLVEVETMVNDVVRRDKDAVEAAGGDATKPATAVRLPDHPIQSQGGVFGPTGFEEVGDGLMTSGVGLFD